MGNDASQVVVGANGQVYVGPLAADAPTAVDDTLDTDFIELGFVSEDGATITDSKTVENIGAWQSFYPIRRIVTEREFTVEFAMRQWNGDNITFAFGGGVVLGGPNFSYTPPDPGEIDERSLILKWQDGTKNYLLYIPRGMATASTVANLRRAQAADLPITFSALSDGDDAAYTLFTDDPAFAGATS